MGDKISCCIMASTIKNTAYSVHILDILEYGLSKGCYSDVTISMPGQKKVIKCHKSVLARSSMFMAHLLESTTKDSEEETHITLCDMSFGEVMAMMNLVYVGKYVRCMISKYNFCLADSLLSTIH